MRPKPQKPRPDFPLFPHASGQWAKKIKGKLRYFGVWADPDAALNEYLRQRDDLQAGRDPAPDADALTVADAVNHFLAAKKRAAENRELSRRTWQEYYATCAVVIEEFGRGAAITSLRPADFAQLRSRLAKGRGLVSLGKHVQIVRSVFKHALDAGLIDRPVTFGPEFRKPSKRAVRLHRAATPKRVFAAAEIRTLIESAKQPMHAMILLGVNCGFGATDLSELRLPALDLAGGWVEHPRPKTGAARRCPLWPETVAAVTEALDRRPLPRTPDLADRVFLTRYGLPWVRVNPTGSPNDEVGKQFAKLVAAANLKRPGTSFYAMRRATETAGGEAKDQVALNLIMGHTPADDEIASIYRHDVSDERLRAVTEAVRRWLFTG